MSEDYTAKCLRALSSFDGIKITLSTTRTSVDTLGYIERFEFKGVEFFSGFMSMENALFKALVFYLSKEKELGVIIE